LKALSEGLVARGHAVTVLATSHTRHTHTIDRHGVRVIKAARLAHLASTPLSPALVQQARHLHADVVNLHMPYPPGDLAALAMRTTPLVVTYHSDVVRQQRLLQVYRPLLHRTLTHAARIIATSAPYIQSSPFLRRYAQKCRVVPLSVDIARFAAADENAGSMLRQRYGVGANDHVVLSVGVLRYYKGLHVLLDAMRHVDATLLIVGDDRVDAQPVHIMKRH
jgi:rhamnosyl/mannosyltransferase